MKNSSDHFGYILPQRIRIWIIVFTTPIALFFSIGGYMEYHPEAGITNAIYHSFQLFILHTPHFEGPIPMKLEIGRWIAAITTTLVAVEIILYIYRTQLEWWKLRRMKYHTIICGIGDVGVALTENFKIFGKNGN